MFDEVILPEDLRGLYETAKRFHEIRMEPSILRELIERIAIAESALRAIVAETPAR